MRNGNYELIVAPPGYPGMRYRGRYCYEHIAVWWEHYGYVPEKGLVVHHKNGDMRDNRIENLELMGAGEHASHHARPKTLVMLKCSWCGKAFEREKRNYAFHVKAGQKNFYCSRTCAGTAPRTAGTRRGIPHGTNNGYGYHKCRCGKCKEAHREHMRKWQQNRKKKDNAQVD